jgi:hypothetical protein
MNTGITKPTKQFTETARQLSALLEAQQASKRPRERQRIEDQLRKEFMDAFELLPDRRKLAQHLYYRFINSAVGPRGALFDHVDFFQRKGNLIIVSQPYGVDEKELNRWTKECGASFTTANEWGYYFPGRASLFFVEFSKQAKQGLERRVREQHR